MTEPPRWSIRPTARFRRDLEGLDQPVRRRIVRELDEIAHLADPRSRGKALVGAPRGRWRYRVGDYRVIVDLLDNELVILALTAGHRSGVYTR
ncbi:MAG: type II toxin-antitoxin system RelE/ParE family toxin [Propionibacteriaceae bacterium]|nr:type II toxin-antitoxin system RelE/ParE family toxin [Propionibacteriaceae bacterium]